jgi:hypothetical protein
MRAKQGVVNGTLFFMFGLLFAGALIGLLILWLRG